MGIVAYAEAEEEDDNEDGEGHKVRSRESSIKLHWKSSRFAIRIDGFWHKIINIMPPSSIIHIIT